MTSYRDPVSDTDTIVEQILTGYDTITVVGASASAGKAAHSVPARMQRCGWRVIRVNPHGGQILGQGLSCASRCA